MRKVAALCLVFCAPALADDFAISSFQFDWKIAKSGDSSLIMRKDEDSVTAILRSDLHALFLPPEDAVEVGIAMGKTDEMWKALKGTKSTSKSLDAGKFRVSFFTGDSGSFYVNVERAERFSIERVTLDREEANAFFPHLRRAKKMADFLDKAIEPNAPKDSDQARKAADLAKSEAERMKAETERAKAEAAKLTAEAEKSAALAQIARQDAAAAAAKRDAVAARDEIESSALKKLNLAKALLSKDKTAGKKRLKEIVDQFEGTPAAAEAADLLKKD